MSKFECPWTISRLIEEKYKLLKTKWSLSDNFRNVCLDLQADCLPVIEATESNFWGCGQDITSVRDGPPATLSEMPSAGLNISGWMIMALTDEMSPRRDGKKWTLTCLNGGDLSHTGFDYLKENFPKCLPDS